MNQLRLADSIFKDNNYVVWFYVLSTEKFISFFLLKFILAQSAGAIEYADCISTEGKTYP